MTTISVAIYKADVVKENHNSSLFRGPLSLIAVQVLI